MFDVVLKVFYNVLNFSWKLSSSDDGRKRQTRSLIIQTIIITIFHCDKFNFSTKQGRKLIVVERILSFASIKYKTYNLNQLRLQLYFFQDWQDDRNRQKVNEENQDDSRWVSKWIVFK